MDQDRAKGIHVEINRPRQRHATVKPEVADIVCAVKGIIGSTYAESFERGFKFLAKCALIQLLGGALQLLGRYGAAFGNGELEYFPIGTPFGAFHHLMKMVAALGSANE